MTFSPRKAYPLLTIPRVPHEPLKTTHQRFKKLGFRRSRSALMLIGAENIDQIAEPSSSRPAIAATIDPYVQTKHASHAGVNHLKTALTTQLKLRPNQRNRYNTLSAYTI
ncbi:hypothetical protein SJAG_03778 [Schizosaccharomyces japonicus yFS275]|uniref:Uncharacterized protein n=1 Tax=Schizosaccharomyces japonicus (strain yFS275 / FY16936) TaxID=402676 RepID=B6K511_SCHJY|nr:hypothetical protein SJAG_03778 [Schizosaccharomyces japonicus yFS275]EEB08615.2 hypothetical protein SJAG_03778 [Schizosaccharomyces japonicus yFS275]